MSRRDELIELCKNEPEKMADLFLSLEARIIALEKRLRKNSQNSDKPPSSERLQKPKPPKRQSKRKAGGQPGHAGKSLKFSAAPDRIVTYVQPNCTKCGHGLRNTPGQVVKRHQEIELPEKLVEIIEHQAIETICPCCAQSNVGEVPTYLRGPVQYGKRFKAFCTYLLVYQLLPYERTGELLATMTGYQPAGGTLKSVLEQAYDTLEPVEAHIRQQLLSAAVAHGDETGIRVDSHTRWMHVFSTSWYTYFFWSFHRGQQAHHVDGLLPDYKGILMHDAYKSYFVFDCEHALCNAHLLRELVALHEQEPPQLWAWQLHRLLRVAWRMVKTARTQGRTALSRPTQLRIQRLFDRIIAPAHQQHPHTERQQGQRGRIAQSDARNLLDRLIAYKDAYLRFLTDFAVPFDNNLAERDIRMAKLQQKISGSFRTDRGADIFCRIRGYISTLRKQHHDLFSALTSLWLARPFFPVPAC